MNCNVNRLTMYSIDSCRWSHFLKGFVSAANGTMSISHDFKEWSAPCGLPGSGTFVPRDQTPGNEGPGWMRVSKRLPSSLEQNCFVCFLMVRFQREDQVTWGLLKNRFWAGTWTKWHDMNDMKWTEKKITFWPPIFFSLWNDNVKRPPAAVEPAECSPVSDARSRASEAWFFVLWKYGDVMLIVSSLIDVSRIFGWNSILVLVWSDSLRLRLLMFRSCGL